MSVAFCPATNALASGSFDESVRVWDLRSCRTMLAIPAHSEPITSVSYTSDGAVLASASYDGESSVYVVWCVCGRLRGRRKREAARARIRMPSRREIDRHLRACCVCALTHAPHPTPSRHTATHTGLIRLWDIAAGGQCLKTIQESGVRAHTRMTNSRNRQFAPAAADPVQTALHTHYVY